MHEIEWTNKIGIEKERNWWTHREAALNQNIDLKIDHGSNQHKTRVNIWRNRHTQAIAEEEEGKTEKNSCRINHNCEAQN